MVGSFDLARYGDADFARGGSNDFAIEGYLDFATGTKHFQLLIVAGLSFLSDAIEVVTSMVLATHVERQWQLSFGQSATIAASVFIGIICGSLLWIPLLEHVGKRPVFVVTAALRPIFGILTTLAGSGQMVVFIRFLVGIAAAGRFISFGILMEFLPEFHRSTIVVWLQFFWTFGTIIVILVGIAVDDWRSLIHYSEMPVLLGAIA